MAHRLHRDRAAFGRDRAGRARRAPPTRWRRLRTTTAAGATTRTFRATPTRRPGRCCSSRGWVAMRAPVAVRFPASFAISEPRTGASQRIPSRGRSGASWAWAGGCRSGDGVVRTPRSPRSPVARSRRARPAVAGRRPTQPGGSSESQQNADRRLELVLVDLTALHHRPGGRVRRDPRRTGRRRSGGRVGAAEPGRRRELRVRHRDVIVDPGERRCRRRRPSTARCGTWSPCSRRTAVGRASRSCAFPYRPTGIPIGEDRWRVVRFGGGIEVSDQHRLFTSAACVAALAS